MKKTILKTAVYIGSFILLFIIGVIISDTIIIARAKHILSIADSLPFEKDMQKAYPDINSAANGFSFINNVYIKRNALPENLKKLDEQITKSDLRNSEIPIETLRKFYQDKNVIAVIDTLSSIPYTTKFSLNYVSEPELYTEKLNVLMKMHNFYRHYLKFCSSEKQHLQTLHAFQKLLIINRALENQNLYITENMLQKFWISAIDALVHYGPNDKRYEEYYKSLQKLIDSLDFKYYPELTIRYNELKKLLEYNSLQEKNPLWAYRNKIGTIKAMTNEFYNTLKTYPLPASLERNPMLEKDIFLQKKIQTQTQLKTLLRLKLYYLKHGFFPEAIEGFPPLPQIEKLRYKRIAPDDFFLSL